MNIDPNKSEDLMDAIEKVAGRASRHIPESYIVALVMSYAERSLEDRGVLKKNRPGCSLIWNPGGPGKTYARKGRKVFTLRIRAKRIKAGWRIVGIEKVEIFAESKETEILNMTDDAEADAIAYATRRDFT